MKWLAKWLATLKFKQGKAARSNLTTAGPKLREFVYLDEVSLRSLLSSQKGGMTDVMSEQVANTYGGEFSGKMSGDAIIAKTEITSRFQTSNSSTLQSSRKATVQSWFRELHDLRGLRLIEPVDNVEVVAKVEDLTNGATSQFISLKSSELRRGALVEFKVRLSAHQTFQLSMLAAEFSGMAEDIPALLNANIDLASIEQFQGINKLLQRLLAGLIPVQAAVVDHVVAEIDGVEYVVHRAAVQGLPLTTRPLEIVGVTEHLAYWKDIRRVLFSDAEFTILCRVSRPGLHDNWVPVKLADMFKGLAPDFASQLNTGQFLPLGGALNQAGSDINEDLMIDALNIYKQNLLSRLAVSLNKDQGGQVKLLINTLKSRVSSAAHQKSAFAALKYYIVSETGVEVEPMLDAELRDAARAQCGLPLFPVKDSARASAPTLQPVGVDKDAARLLDSEIIAMYW